MVICRCCSIIAFLLSPPFSFNSLCLSYISLSHSLSFCLSFLSSFLSLFHPKKENRKMGRESRNVCVKYVPVLLGISGAAAKNNLHQNADILSMSFCRKKQSKPKRASERDVIERMTKHVLLQVCMCVSVWCAGMCVCIQCFGKVSVCEGL